MRAFLAIGLVGGGGRIIGWWFPVGQWLPEGAWGGGWEGVGFLKWPLLDFRVCLGEHWGGGGM